MSFYRLTGWLMLSGLGLTGAGCFTDKSDSADLPGGIPFVAKEPALLELKECARFFTNRAPWRATLEVRSGENEKKSVMVKGQLIVSGSRIQAILETGQPKKTSVARASAVNALVWNEASRNGLAFSDELQGYCRLAPAATATNLPTKSSAPDAQGRMLAAFQDGNRIVRVFANTAEGQFPATIDVEYLGGHNRIFIGAPSFHAVPDSEFLTERGMTAYPSAAAMEEELFQRLGDLKGNAVRTRGAEPTFHMDEPR